MSRQSNARWRDFSTDGLRIIGAALLSVDVEGVRPDYEIRRRLLDEIAAEMERRDESGPS